MLTNKGAAREIDVLVQNDAEGTVLSKLIVANHSQGHSTAVGCAKSTRLDSVILYGKEAIGGKAWVKQTLVLNTCILVGKACAAHPAVVFIRNSIHFKEGFEGWWDTESRVPPKIECTVENSLMRGFWRGIVGEFQGCTFYGVCSFERTPVVLRDCIVAKVKADVAGGVVENCNVFGDPPYINLAKPGKGCFSRDPQFRDPEHFDYRLKPTSPCRGKASDGGDMGCRFTPEMLEMLQKALELRKKGIIKF